MSYFFLFTSYTSFYFLFLLSTLLSFHYSLHEFPLFDELSHFFSRIFYQFISGSFLGLRGEGGASCYPASSLPLLYWFLLTLTPVLISAFVPLFIILLVCIGPFFPCLGCVVFLPFLGDQPFSNVLSQRMRYQFLWPPTLPHGHAVFVFIFLFSTYFLSFHQIILIHSFVI
jgi:hypothetical protein